MSSSKKNDWIHENGVGVTSINNIEKIKDFALRSDEISIINNKKTDIIKLPPLPNTISPKKSGSLLSPHERNAEDVFFTKYKARSSSSSDRSPLPSPPVSIFSGDKENNSDSFIKHLATGSNANLPPPPDDLNIEATCGVLPPVPDVLSKSFFSNETMTSPESSKNDGDFSGKKLDKKATITKSCNILPPPPNIGAYFKTPEPIKKVKYPINIESDDFSNYRTNFTRRLSSAEGIPPPPISIYRSMDEIRANTLGVSNRSKYHDDNYKSDSKEKLPPPLESDPSIKRHSNLGLPPPPASTTMSTGSSSSHSFTTQSFPGLVGCHEDSTQSVLSSGAYYSGKFILPSSIDIESRSSSLSTTSHESCYSNDTSKTITHEDTTKTHCETSSEISTYFIYDSPSRGIGSGSINNGKYEVSLGNEVPSILSENVRSRGSNDGINEQIISHIEQNKSFIDNKGTGESKLDRNIPLIHKSTPRSDDNHEGSLEEDDDDSSLSSTNFDNEDYSKTDISALIDTLSPEERDVINKEAAEGNLDEMIGDLTDKPINYTKRNSQMSMGPTSSDYFSGRNSHNIRSTGNFKTRSSEDAVESIGRSSKGNEIECPPRDDVPVNLGSNSSEMINIRNDAVKVNSASTSVEQHGISNNSSNVNRLNQKKMAENTVNIMTDSKSDKIHVSANASLSKSPDLGEVLPNDNFSQYEVELSKIEVNATHQENSGIGDIFSNIDNKVSHHGLSEGKKSDSYQEANRIGGDSVFLKSIHTTSSLGKVESEFQDNANNSENSTKYSSSKQISDSSSMNVSSIHFNSGNMSSEWRQNANEYKMLDQQVKHRDSIKEPDVNSIHLSSKQFSGTLSEDSDFNISESSKKCLEGKFDINVEISKQKIKDQNFAKEPSVNSKYFSSEQIHVASIEKNSYSQLKSNDINIKERSSISNDDILEKRVQNKTYMNGYTDDNKYDKSEHIYVATNRSESYNQTKLNFVANMGKLSTYDNDRIKKDINDCNIKEELEYDYICKKIKCNDSNCITDKNTDMIYFGTGHTCKIFDQIYAKDNNSMISPSVNENSETKNHDRPSTEINKSSLGIEEDKLSMPILRIPKFSFTAVSLNKGNTFDCRNMNLSAESVVNLASPDDQKLHIGGDWKSSLHDAECNTADKLKSDTLDRFKLNDVNDKLIETQKKEVESRYSSQDDIKLGVISDSIGKCFSPDPVNKRYNGDSNSFKYLIPPLSYKNIQYASCNKNGSDKILADNIQPCSSPITAGKLACGGDKTGMLLSGQMSQFQEKGNENSSTRMHDSTDADNMGPLISDQKSPKNDHISMHDSLPIPFYSDDVLNSEYLKQSKKYSETAKVRKDYNVSSGDELISSESLSLRDDDISATDSSDYETDNKSEKVITSSREIVSESSNAPEDDLYMLNERTNGKEFGGSKKEDIGLAQPRNGVGNVKISDMGGKDNRYKDEFGSLKLKFDIRSPKTSNDRELSKDMDDIKKIMLNNQTSTSNNTPTKCEKTKLQRYQFNVPLLDEKKISENGIDINDNRDQKNSEFSDNDRINQTSSNDSRTFRISNNSVSKVEDQESESLSTSDSSDDGYEHENSKEDCVQSSESKDNDKSKGLVTETLYEKGKDDKYHGADNTNKNEQHGLVNESLLLETVEANRNSIGSKMNHSSSSNVVRDPDDSNGTTYSRRFSDNVMISAQKYEEDGVKKNEKKKKLNTTEMLYIPNQVNDNYTSRNYLNFDINMYSDFDDDLNNKRSNEKMSSGRGDSYNYRKYSEHRRENSFMNRSFEDDSSKENYSAKRRDLDFAGTRYKNNYSHSEYDGSSGARVSSSERGVTYSSRKDDVRKGYSSKDSKSERTYKSYKEESSDIGSSYSRDGSEYVQKAGIGDGVYAGNKYKILSKMNPNHVRSAKRQDGINVDINTKGAGRRLGVEIIDHYGNSERSSAEKIGMDYTRRFRRSSSSDDEHHKKRNQKKSSFDIIKPIERPNENPKIKHDMNYTRRFSRSSSSDDEHHRNKSGRNFSSGVQRSSGQRFSKENESKNRKYSVSGSNKGNSTEDSRVRGSNINMKDSSFSSGSRIGAFSSDELPGHSRSSIIGRYDTSDEKIGRNSSEGDNSHIGDYSGNYSIKTSSRKHNETLNVKAHDKLRNYKNGNIPVVGKRENDRKQVENESFDDSSYLFEPNETVISRNGRLVRKSGKSVSSVRNASTNKVRSLAKSVKSLANNHKNTNASGADKFSGYGNAAMNSTLNSHLSGSQGRVQFPDFNITSDKEFSPKLVNAKRSPSGSASDRRYNAFRKNGTTPEIDNRSSNFGSKLFFSNDFMSNANGSTSSMVRNSSLNNAQYIKPVPGDLPKPDRSVMDNATFNIVGETSSVTNVSSEITPPRSSTTERDYNYSSTWKSRGSIDLSKMQASPGSVHVAKDSDGSKANKAGSTVARRKDSVTSPITPRQAKNNNSYNSPLTPDRSDVSRGCGPYIVKSQERKYKNRSNSAMDITDHLTIGIKKSKNGDDIYLSESFDSPKHSVKLSRLNLENEYYDKRSPKDIRNSDKKVNMSDLEKRLNSPSRFSRLSLEARQSADPKVNYMPDRNNAFILSRDGPYDDSEISGNHKDDDLSQSHNSLSPKGVYESKKLTGKLSPIHLLENDSHDNLIVRPPTSSALKRNDHSFEPDTRGLNLNKILKLNKLTKHQYDDLISSGKGPIIYKDRSDELEHKRSNEVYKHMGTGNTESLKEGATTSKMDIREIATTSPEVDNYGNSRSLTERYTPFKNGLSSGLHQNSTEDMHKHTTSLHSKAEKNNEILIGTNSTGQHEHNVCTSVNKVKNKSNSRELTERQKFNITDLIFSPRSLSVNCQPNRNGVFRLSEIPDNESYNEVSVVSVPVTSDKRREVSPDGYTISQKGKSSQDDGGVSYPRKTIDKSADNIRDSYNDIRVTRESQLNTDSYYVNSPKSGVYGEENTSFMNARKLSFNNMQNSHSRVEQLCKKPKQEFRSKSTKGTKARSYTTDNDDKARLKFRNSDTKLNLSEGHSLGKLFGSPNSHNASTTMCEEDDSERSSRLDFSSHSYARLYDTDPSYSQSITVKTCPVTKNSCLCHTCNLPIRSKCYSTKGFFYHISCLRCCNCNRVLLPSSVTLCHGDFYCKKCAVPLEHDKCSICKNLIINEDATGFRPYGTKYDVVHLRCFRCHQCRCQLQKNMYKVLVNLPYCVKCYDACVSRRCYICGKSIISEFIDFGNERTYHNHCFKCTECKIPLKGRKFIINLGMPYCREHGSKFVQFCECCKQELPIDSDRVMFREKYYHRKCLCCGICKKHLMDKQCIHSVGQKPTCNNCYKVWLRKQGLIGPGE